MEPQESLCPYELLWSSHLPSSVSALGSDGLFTAFGELHHCGSPRHCSRAYIYFFLEDVFPNQPGGGRLLRTPSVLKAIFDTPEDDPNYNPLPEERPGGFAWGEGQRLGG